MCFKIKSDENVVCLFFFVSQRLMIDGLSITKEYVNTLIWGLSFSLFIRKKDLILLFRRKSAFFFFKLIKMVPKVLASKHLFKKSIFQ